MKLTGLVIRRCHLFTWRILTFISQDHFFVGEKLLTEFSINVWLAVKIGRGRVRCPDSQTT